MTLPTDSRGAEAAGLQSEVGARIWPVHVAKESEIYPGLTPLPRRSTHISTRNYSDHG
jgi:hypothetical protein